MKNYQFFALLLCLMFAPCFSQNASNPKQKIDVDLTVLSSTMLFSEVYNIMANPKKYLGKTIKVSGYYAYSRSTGFHFVIMKDAAACCAQGLEFRLNYPNAYLIEDADIELVGTFKSYENLDNTYYYISTDKVSIKK
jgi:hypothetical protein